MGNVSKNQVVTRAFLRDPRARSVILLLPRFKKGLEKTEDNIDRAFFAQPNARPHKIHSVRVGTTQTTKSQRMESLTGMHMMDG